ncbi:MAG TPA: peptidoglycan DD-metalloendopeptidase family protein [Longilinea sp.]|nr:peptidoglycan DD-metalloendopeptidase family protein [Longilinea sp.]
MLKKAIAIFIALTIIILPNAAPVHAQDDNPPVYVVQPGDTLNVIADKFGVSVADIIDANQISNPNLISAGTQLVIPGLEGVHGVLTTSTVQLGDNLTSLSLQYGLSTDTLIRLNRVTSPSEIYAGSSLILPEQSDQQASSLAAVSTQSGGTMLEDAVLANMNPWALAQTNDLQNNWDVLTGENLYYHPTSASQQTSLVSAQIKQISISPLPIVQGDTVEIKLTTAQPTDLSGTLDDHDLHFFQNGDNEYVALQGIAVDAQTGLAGLQISGKGQDGNTFDIDQQLLLEAGSFVRYTGSLEVDPSTIDPAVTVPEYDEVLAAVTPATPDKLWDGQWTQPLLATAPYVLQDCMMSPFGAWRTYNNTISSYHTGIDLAVCTDSADGKTIHAAAAGTVVFIGPLTVRGNATIIDHGWGVYSAYYHQSEIDVKVGDHVTAGQAIGIMGATGRVTGPHLHFEVWVNQVTVQPWDWLDNTYP